MRAYIIDPKEIQRQGELYIVNRSIDDARKAKTWREYLLILDSGIRHRRLGVLSAGDLSRINPV